MDHTDLLRASDLNYAEFQRETGRWHAEAEILEGDGLLCVAGPSRFAPVNTAMRTRHAANAAPAELFAEATAFFAAKQRGFKLAARAHLDADLIAYAHERGFPPISDAPGMVLEAPVGEAAAPSGIRLREVRRASDVASFAAVVAPAYGTMGMPEEVTRAHFVLPEALLEPHISAWLCEVEGRPVCAALALLSHGIAGLYWVGTLPEARGKGLADLCTRRVSNEAFTRGAQLVVLQASPQGEPIYRAMGYREITRYPWILWSTRQP